MFTLITLPVDFVTNLTAYIGDIFTDLNPLILLAIGLPLAFWFVSKVIGLVRFRTRGK